ncbi:cystatin-like protein [Drosophila bipectinata]|uniref:cystatin-like protein n=1 Tax=Drosophila bipectinata TaxID=42026 RepID=UPI001C8A0FCA|nr:cystatin-like protein [Drosophila bipectinata]
MSNEPILGGVSKLQGEELKEALELLETSLAKLEATDGLFYKAVNVTSVTGQTVAGSLYTYELELQIESDKKPATVTIWSRIWLKEDGTNIKIHSGGQLQLDRTW